MELIFLTMPVRMSSFKIIYRVNLRILKLHSSHELLPSCQLGKIGSKHPTGPQILAAQAQSLKLGVVFLVVSDNLNELVNI